MRRGIFLRNVITLVEFVFAFILQSWFEEMKEKLTSLQKREKTKDQLSGWFDTWL